MGCTSSAPADRRRNVRQLVKPKPAEVQSPLPQVRGANIGGRPTAPKSEAAPPQSSGTWDQRIPRSVKFEDLEPSPFSPAPAAASKKQEYKGVNFKNVGPTVVGTATALFKEGLLYRIEVAADSNAWYFYNDTNSFQMTVKYAFGGESQLRFGDTVKNSRNTATQEINAEMVVYPGQTLLFCKGTVNGYKADMLSGPLDAAYMSSEAKRAAQAINTELQRMKAAPGLAEPLKLSDEEVVALCVKHGVPFVDTHFFPGAESLQRSTDTEAVEVVPWERPSSYLAPERANALVTAPHARPDDIDQGALGDCYLLCSLAAIAEYPLEVEQMFRAGRSVESLVAERGVGAFRVVMNSSGWWRTVLLDSYLPVKGGAPTFARTCENPSDLWVSLAEKAYAKLHGSYSAIVGGNAIQAQTDLTGYPSMEWPKFKEGDATFQRMLSAVKEGYLLSVYTPAEGSKAAAQFDASKHGLVLGHAYTVLDAKEIHSNGETLQLVRIRNPWGTGNGEWTGDFSDTSALWKKFPEADAVCTHTGADGCFWMRWTDVQEYFAGGGVCYTEKTFADYRVKGTVAPGSGSSVSFEITVKDKPVWLCITLSQEDARTTPNPSAHKYVDGLISVWAQQASGYENIFSSGADPENPSGPNNFCYYQARDMGMYVRLEPSATPYVVVPMFDAQSVKVPTQYVVGFQTERVIGDGLDVNFVSVGPDSDIAKLLTPADYKSSAPVTCAWQCNPDFGHVLNRTGTKLEHFNVPLPQ